MSIFMLAVWNCDCILQTTKYWGGFNLILLVFQLLTQSFYSIDHPNKWTTLIQFKIIPETTQTILPPSFYSNQTHHQLKYSQQISLYYCLLYCHFDALYFLLLEFRLWCFLLVLIIRKPWWLNCYSWFVLFD